MDVHSAVASTGLRRLAADLAGATGYAPALPLTADAHHLVRAVARELLTPAQLGEARVAALDLAAASGIVAVHECAGPEIGGIDDWRALRALDHGVEIIGYWGEAVTSADDARALHAETGARGLAGDLFVDGALGSRTAWLHQPYRDAPDTCGNAYLDTDAVEAHLSACTEAGITAGFHVIGDAAATAVVDALDRVAERFGAPAIARCGHRLEHLEMVTVEQAARLGALGVVASMQPNFDAAWGGAHGMYAQRLGADRARLLNPFALLASQGVPLAFGSDSPVTSVNPWATVRAATSAPDPGQRDLGPRGVCGRHPRLLARRRCARRRGRHPGAGCARVIRGVGRARGPGGRGACGHRAALVHRSAVPGARPAPTRRRRSATDVPPDGAPGCRHPWLRGVGATGPAPRT